MTEPVARHAALAVSSRRWLLELLQASPRPLDAAELARSVGLHVTTVRFHLDLLQRAGLVRHAAERAGRAGRPKQLYSAVAPAAATEGYRQLAEVLAAALAGDRPDGPARAEEIGQRWADATVAPPPAPLTEAEGAGGVAGLFQELGFAPRLVEAPGRRRLELDACPFRDVARAYPEVVCSVHLGLLRGALRRLGLPAAAASSGLRPFVEPELCIADLPSAPGRRRRPVAAG